MSCFCDSLTCNEGRSLVRTDNNLVEQVEDQTKELWLRARHPLTRRSPIPRSATLSSSPSSLLLHHLIWLLWLALRKSAAAKKWCIFFDKREPDEGNQCCIYQLSHACCVKPRGARLPVTIQWIIKIIPKILGKKIFTGPLNSQDHDALELIHATSQWWD